MESDALHHDFDESLVLLVYLVVDDSSEVGYSNRVIEVLVLREPLISQVSSAVLHQSNLNGVDVLHAPILRNVVMSSWKCCVELHSNRERQPSLPNLGVLIPGAVVVSVILAIKASERSSCLVTSLFRKITLS